MSTQEEPSSSVADVANIKTADVETKQPVESNEAPATEFAYMSVQGGGGKIGLIPTFKIHEPVHEQMAMAAIIHS